MSTGPPGHINAIHAAFRDIERLDRELDRLDDQIEQQTADAWDAIDAEPLIEQRDTLRYSIVTLAGTITSHGTRLIDGWKDHELANIGRHYSMVDGPLALVLRECPGIDTHPVFQRLTREAVPF